MDQPGRMARPYDGVVGASCDGIARYTMFGLPFFGRSAPRIEAPGAADSAACSAATPAPVACFHCTLPLPEPVPAWVAFEGRTRPMCCSACAMAARWIIDLGRGDWYAGRSRG
ncbi:MAG: heavy metal translocating P-type ATPase metal-binding domain-containing protein [Burkholderiales bacterium]